MLAQPRSLRAVAVSVTAQAGNHQTTPTALLLLALATCQTHPCLLQLLLQLLHGVLTHLRKLLLQLQLLPYALRCSTNLLLIAPAVLRNLLLQLMCITVQLKKLCCRVPALLLPRHTAL